LAEALENGHAARKAEKKIARLKTALEQSKAAREAAEATLEQLNAENSDLKVVLQAVNTEIATLNAEREKQGEKEREMPQIQFQILSLLPNEHGSNWLRIDEIARALKRPSDEIEVHSKKLQKAGLVISRFNAHDALVWHRSDEGNELLIARRLAGDKEAQEKKPKRSKYGQLSQSEEIALLMMAENLNDGATEPEIAKRLEYTLAMTFIVLKGLAGKHMAAAKQ
jgi:DNA-binding MarR family transcriptional regulator